MNRNHLTVQPQPVTSNILCYLKNKTQVLWYLPTTRWFR